MQPQRARPRRRLDRVGSIIVLATKKRDGRLPAPFPGIEIAGDDRCSIRSVQRTERPQHVEQRDDLTPPRLEGTTIEQREGGIEMHVNQTKMPAFSCWIDSVN